MPLVSRRDPEAALRVFTVRGRGPGAALPVVILSVTVAAIAMHVDKISQYSGDAYVAGILGSAGLAWAVSFVCARARAWRRRAALVLPTVGGAIVGVVVQDFVLDAMQGRQPLRDLGGAIDTMHPTEWLLGGIVLGGLPALAVSVFLFLATSAIGRLRALDASQSFTVVYTGAAGIVAAMSTLFVSRWESTPLFFATGAAFVAVGLALVVDGARLRVLRRAFQGDGLYELVAAERFASHALASMVETAGNRALVRIAPSPDYRSSASEPIALVGEDEASTCAPILRRRVGGGSMLLAMILAAGLGAVSHGFLM